jgi:hypothetical protein
MKKYLMTGMVAVAMCAAFTSCSKDTDFTEVYNDNKSKEYAESFVKTFGVTIDPENDWGFGTTTRADEGAVWTRAINPQYNNWAASYIVPANPMDNDYEISRVTSHFTNTTYTDDAECVNFDNFFVYSISYTANGQGHMDNFYCGPTKNNMEHLNNLNAGEISNNGWYGHSQLVEGGGSRFWNYQSSEGTRHTFEHFHVVDGATIDSRLAGYYYIGFDYESAGGSSNQVHAPDGKYNDVILRISKAIPNHTNWQGRIFCEDLGAIGDFDFNDVVFDYDLAWDKTWIRIVCAGGRLPIYVCGKEVHAEFGQNTSVLINTGAGARGIDGLEPVVFYVNQTFNSPADIPVLVGSDVENNDQSSSANLRRLVANKGEAPQKVCVQWATPAYQTEYNNISLKYPKFVNYIQDHNVRWWE